MRDLRLIGVDEDGRHLMFAGPDDTTYRAPLTEALRRAVRTTAPGPGARPADPTSVGPREVQALIRAGASAQDVADQTGWTVEKVRKYEGPIVAERAYVAQLATQVRLRPRGAGSASASAPTLADRVTQRLRARGVDPDPLEWNAWRVDGRWTVALAFAAGGRQRQATWSFDPTDRALHAADDEARWLSEDEPAPPAAAPVPDSVYDVEAEGGLDEPPERVDPAPRGEAARDIDLVTDLRARTGVRGRRAGGTRRRLADRSPDGPALHPVHGAGLDPTDPGNPAESRRGDVDPTAVPGQQTLPGTAFATEQHEPQPPLEAPPAAPEIDDSDSPDAVPPAARKAGRTPVPAWDDIVFGGNPGSHEPS